MKDCKIELDEFIRIKRFENHTILKERKEASVRLQKQYEKETSALTDENAELWEKEKQFIKKVKKTLSISNLSMKIIWTENHLLQDLAVYNLLKSCRGNFNSLCFLVL